MSENDFIIVDEEETNKEDNKQDTGREEEKKEVDKLLTILKKMMTDMREYVLLSSPGECDWEDG